ncbi:MAG: DNA topology modulation protein FlaR, partial [Pseudomonadota bacterium]
MHKVIITGANGVGKSTIAARLGEVRPNIPIISYDALKLQTNWNTRPADESLEALRAAISTDNWILEGGPSMLQVALDHANALIWLDPPDYKRSWRLFTRPLKSFGRTRSEIPMQTCIAELANQH